MIRDAFDISWRIAAGIAAFLAAGALYVAVCVLVVLIGAAATQVSPWWWVAEPFGVVLGLAGAFFVFQTLDWIMDGGWGHLTLLD